MSRVLLDTNVVSYIMKGHSLAARFVPHLIGNVATISFVTVGELYKGAAWANWGPAKLQRLDQLLATYLVIGVDVNICKAWASVQRERRAQPMSGEDAWIAATALVHHLPLVTHDVADFTGITGLQLLTAI